MLKNLNYIYILTLLILSFIFNYYFGSVGVFPIDTFAFFDSAFSINNGFFPIRDYWTSNGFLVDIKISPAPPNLRRTSPLFLTPEENADTT